MHIFFNEEEIGSEKAFGAFMLLEQTESLGNVFDGFL
jgi:hypothetical protein